MPFLFFAAIALIGAAIHVHRDRDGGIALCAASRRSPVRAFSR